MSDERLDTAHELWDAWWGEAKQRAHWSEPEPAVTSFIPMLLARGVERVLDVGSGIGRHALAYARAGFDVTAIDASPTGLGELCVAAKAEALAIDTCLGSFSDLPLQAGSVDHVLAWNVVYHGDRAVVATALAEICRVLRAGGTAQLTMLSKRHRAYRVGREVRPDTFVDPTSSGDKDHPHFYLDAHGLSGMLAAAGFDPLSMVDVDQHPPGAWHWTVVAELTAVRNDPSEVEPHF